MISPETRFSSKSHFFLTFRGNSWLVDVPLFLICVAETRPGYRPERMPRSG